MPRTPLSSDPPAKSRASAEIHTFPATFATEAELVAACVARKPTAARVVWDRYAGLVRGLLRRALGRTDVEDTLQEAFMRFFRRVDRLRDPSKLRSFVVGITMRVAREELRRRRVRRWLRLTPNGELPEPRAPSTDVHAAEALRHLELLLDRMDADTRIVFVLRFVESIPTTEIAEALECSLATAKRRVKRARERVEAAAKEDPVLCAYVASEAGDE